MAYKKTEKNENGWCFNWRHLCRVISLPNEPFQNKYSIEDFIDNYFFLQVPDHLSIAENHARVNKLIFDLIITSEDWQKIRILDEE